MSVCKADWKSGGGLIAAVARETGMFSGIAETASMCCLAVTSLQYAACFPIPVLCRTAYLNDYAAPFKGRILFYAHLLTGKFVFHFMRIFNTLQMWCVAFLRKRPENQENQVNAGR